MEGGGRSLFQLRLQGARVHATQLAQYGKCSDASVTRIWEGAAHVRPEQGGAWVSWMQVEQSFDNIFTAFCTLFEISTTEGWVDVMLAAVDSRGPFMHPQRDGRRKSNCFTDMEKPTTALPEFCLRVRIWAFSIWTILQNYP